MSLFTRREWLFASAATLSQVALVSASTRLPDDLGSFQYDHQVGTSLDVWLEADADALQQAEEAALAEVERLRKVFSLYDPASELSQFNASRGSVLVSEDFAEVLQDFEKWQPLTGGVLNPQVGVLVERWQRAEREQALPSTVELQQLAEQLAPIGWHRDGSTVSKLTPHPLNLNSAAKGYILDQLAKLLKALPGVRGGLVNLGGDLVTFGNTTWPIGVQNPLTPADNAAPLGWLNLNNQAIATSGGYLRTYTIHGQQFSHLIDPRNGQPTSNVLSATVRANSSRTANVLATALCSLSPTEGLKLLARLPDVAGLIVSASGQVFTSPNFHWQAAPQPINAVNRADGWPADFELTVNVELPMLDNSKRYRRPYVAVWIEDSAGKPVRTLQVWGNSNKYLRDLTDWWKIYSADKDLIKATTRATRGPGKYSLTWDGKDDKGKLVEQGTYTVRVEVHREHGKHLRQVGKIDCKATSSTIKLEKNEETAETVVTFGKKK